MRSFGVAICVLCVQSLAAQSRPEIVLERFQAFLFNARTGSLSADVLQEPRPDLGNVPIGSFASTSTLVVVKIKVGRAPTPKTLRVRLVATESGTAKFAPKGVAGRDRVILDQSSPLGQQNEEGMTHVGFWLSGTGCRSVQLKATLTGGPTSPALTETIPFICYE